MNYKFILCALIFGLLLAGCTGQQAPPSGTTGTQPSGTGGGTMGSGAAPSMNETPEEGTMPETAPNDSGGATAPSGSGGDVFSGLNYAGIMALGLPGKCDITSSYQGEAMEVTLYFDGAGNSRTESPVDDPAVECSKFIVIQSDKVVYIGCEGEKYPPGTQCDWMMMESEDTGNTTMQTQVDVGSGGGFSTDYSDVPASQISCVPWVPDSTMFQAPGKLCTISDLMQGYQT